MQSPTVPSSSRMHWMDTYRGLAILLGVFFHAVGNFKSATGLSWISGFDHVSMFFDPYRMPFLLVLSGLLLQRALAKPLAHYLGGRCARSSGPFSCGAAPS